MGKLLRADLFRAFRFKIFYVLAAVNAVFGIISVFNQLSWRGLDAGVSAFDVMQDGFGSGVAFIGILNAVLVAIFIGHEYACGAMRNKVMTGGGRQKIYLSELIVSCTMCAASRGEFPERSTKRSCSAENTGKGTRNSNAPLPTYRTI